MTGPVPTHHHPRHLIRLLGAICVAMLTALALTSCGSGSGTGLIPASDAVALKGDLQEVARVTKTANGNCSATNAAIRDTENDLADLPSSVDSALRERLNEGISNLRARALEACEETVTKEKTVKEVPPTATSTTTTPPVTTVTTTPPVTTVTTTPEENTVPEESTTPEENTVPEESTTPAVGGGTVAPTTPEAGVGAAAGGAYRALGSPTDHAVGGVNPFGRERKGA